MIDCVVKLCSSENCIYNKLSNCMLFETSIGEYGQCSNFVKKDLEENTVKSGNIIKIIYND